MSYANRHQVEERLAELAPHGAIVEIGGGYGNGAIALSHGTAHNANLPIYVIDPYIPYQDKLGAKYGPETEEEFYKNTEAAGVHVELIKEDALQVAKTWKERVGLLWIDLTMEYNQLNAIFQAWWPFVEEGGYVGITGLEYTHLGTKRIAMEAKQFGFTPVLEDQGLVACLHKTVHKRAVFYIASSGDDGRYVFEAVRSAKSVIEKLKLPVFLFLEGEVKQDTSIFDRVYELPPQQGPFWYLDSTRYFNLAVRELADFDQLLYLDVDTFICRPCIDIFYVLDQFDFALGQEPQRDAIESAVGVPSAFSTMGIGVNVFRNTESMKEFFADWLRRYEKYKEVYDNNDQAALRDALYEDRWIRWLTLPPEYSLRFDFGCWVVGVVRVIHGRIGGISTPPLDPIAEEINRTYRMRLFSHGSLIPGYWDD